MPGMSERKLLRRAQGEPLRDLAEGGGGSGMHDEGARCAAPHAGAHENAIAALG